VTANARAGTASQQGIEGGDVAVCQLKLLRTSTPGALVALLVYGFDGDCHVCARMTGPDVGVQCGYLLLLIAVAGHTDHQRSYLYLTLVLELLLLQLDVKALLRCSMGL
jgi:hypothetical protein